MEFVNCKDDVGGNSMIRMGQKKKEAYLGKIAGGIGSVKGSVSIGNYC